MVFPGMSIPHLRALHTRKLLQNGRYTTMQLPTSTTESPDGNLSSLLEACTTTESTMQVHSCIVSTSNTTPFLQTKLLTKYSTLGNLDHVRKLFREIHNPNVFAWNSVLKSNVAQGNHEEALQLYRAMHKQNTAKPNHLIFPFVLRSCGATQSLHNGMAVHLQALKHGYGINVYVGNSLVDFYCKCRYMELACQVFDEMPERNVVSFTTLIGGYVGSEMYLHAMEIFRGMGKENVKPNHVSLASVLPACSELEDLWNGRVLHGYAIVNNFESSLLVGNVLVNLYVKCGRMEDACQVFDEMSQRNLVSWTSMITGHFQNGNSLEALLMFCQMRKEALRPDHVCALSGLSACSDLGCVLQGEGLHCYAIKCAFDKETFLGNKLIDMYAKCNRLDDAKRVFRNMTQRSLSSWNALMSGCLQGNVGDVFELFHELKRLGIRPDCATMVSLISACARFGLGRQGKSIHAYVMKFSMDVRNSLVVMYSKCKDLNSAIRVFENMPSKDLMSWNAMISAYDQNGHPYKALELFYQMLKEKVPPDRITVLNVLATCADVEDFEEHSDLVSNCIAIGELESDIQVRTAFVDLFVKHKRMKEAHSLFNAMPQRSTISWNVMISGYASHGPLKEACLLFSRMLFEAVAPDSATLISLVSVCSQIAALLEGESVHGYALKHGFLSDLSIGNALVDMYSKCGEIETAQVVFERMVVKDVITWSALIAGYGKHGDGEKALELFSEMLQEGLKPTHITFVSVLSACSHAGLVEEGRLHFSSMDLEYGISPRAEHIACMVDLLGRAGHLEEAYNLVQTMPFDPNGILPFALLNACKIHGNVELAERAAENPRYHMLLSNTHAISERYNGVSMVEEGGIYYLSKSR